MRIIIYNSSSFGGCYDYGKALISAYQDHPKISHAEWWLPKNSPISGTSGIRKLFIRDKPFFSGKLGRQIHFFYRILFNPIRLWLRLRAQPNSTVIFNDFEQLTAFLWVPLFRHSLKGKHQFAIILHDPDRDAYPPSKSWSIYSMKLIMSIMDFAFFHHSLPNKPYYQNNPRCRFMDIPHGFYPSPDPDMEMEKKLKQTGGLGKRMVILGNIREEKNYHLAIEALAHFPDYQLLIAGSASNTRVNLEQYKNQAEKLGVSNRVVWIEKFLSGSEMAAIIEQSDVVLLNYAPSFTSQSGILNLVAPYRKNLIVSDGPSSLASTMKRFHLGEIIEPQSVSALIKGLKNLETNQTELGKNWDDYLAFASWNHHVELAIDAFTSNDPK